MERNLQADSIVGRIRRPYASVTVSGQSLFVRLDSEHDSAFWCQVELSRETLEEALRQMELDATVSD